MGTSHARSAAPCQDAGRCEVVLTPDGSEVLVASVADGAGSASQSAFGAQLAVDIFQRLFAGLARDRSDLDFLQQDRALAWLADTQAAIGAVAEAGGFQPGDYACTFLGAVVGPGVAAFVQIGDGAIVVADRADGQAGHDWVFWPQHGEFANSTFFVTMQDAAAMLQFERREAGEGRGCVRELAMFSDGLERLILDMAGRTVHSPSLRPILGWLAGLDAASCGAAPSDVIAAYLGSAGVNRRTDDDKTLVVATRAAVVPAAAAP